MKGVVCGTENNVMKGIGCGREWRVEGNGLLKQRCVEGNCVLHRIVC
jgi:hypothetical protein